MLNCRPYIAIGRRLADNYCNVNNSVVVIERWFLRQVLFSMNFCSCLVKRDKTCACIVSHTYKQFKKLWDNPEKASAAFNTNKMVGKFDPDIDRSTSSDTGECMLSEITSSSSFQIHSTLADVISI